MTKYLLRRHHIGEVTGGSKKCALQRYLYGTLSVHDDMESAIQAAHVITRSEKSQSVSRMIPGGNIAMTLLDWGLEIVRSSEEGMSRITAYATVAEAEAAHPLYLRSDGWGWSEVANAA